MATYRPPGSAGVRKTAGKGKTTNERAKQRAREAGCFEALSRNRNYENALVLLLLSHLIATLAKSRCYFMARSQKPKKLSWAPDANLCQVITPITPLNSCASSTICVIELRFIENSLGPFINLSLLVHRSFGLHGDAMRK
ncbi:hypothetical protein ACLOJK_027893 [Asimina triloba]